MLAFLSVSGNDNGILSGNTAGSGNPENGDGNLEKSGNGNGNRNEFGTDNSVLDGNSGLSIGRRKILSGFQAFGTYAGKIIDDITQPLLPGTADCLWVSPNSSRKPNGNINAAGSATLPTATGISRITGTTMTIATRKTLRLAILYLSYPSTLWHSQFHSRSRSESQSQPHSLTVRNIQGTEITTRSGG
ncbi:hypothetical protein JHW43_009048 [Diplocarpon mali]|nr:hypothetical protein JHW43_009048 [Diplocarpon mali]